jgi:hypothetical protein
MGTVFSVVLLFGLLSGIGISLYGLLQVIKKYKKDNDI